MHSLKFTKFLLNSTVYWLLTTGYWLPCAAQEVEKPVRAVCTENSEACNLVNTWFNEKTAVGNKGDVYDNRDNKHSSIEMDRYPQMTLKSYTSDQQARRENYGAQWQLVNGVTIGNSSTAFPNMNVGSNPRAVYYTKQNGLNFLYSQYRANNLYVYPGHYDYRPGHNGMSGEGFGDLFPTNTPYIVISQGSSGTDRPFLRAFVLTLAAFRPEVKWRLVKEGLLMPTLQMILRISNKGIETPSDYLTGKAHPPVFNGKNVDPVKMVTLAHDITSDTIPPMVQMHVISEVNIPADADSNDMLSEVLVDTPDVIARIFRSKAYTKRFTIDASESFDLHKRPLKFHWVLLQGDPEHVRIHPHTNGMIADIEVDYQSRRPIQPDSPLESNRVDIGVFVHNGIYFSAPAFITVYTLDNERRVYDKQGHLIKMDDKATEIAFWVTNWQGIVDFLSKDSTPSMILRGQFNSDELAYLTKLLPEIAESQKALEDEKRKEKQGQSNKENVTAKGKVYDTLIGTSRSELKGKPVKRRIAEAITNLKDDLNFYNNHREEIQKMAQRISPRIRAHFLGEVMKFQKDGLISTSGELQPTTSDGYNVIEVYQIKSFNSWIINEVLYPGVFKKGEVKNLVPTQFQLGK